MLEWKRAAIYAARVGHLLGTISDSLSGSVRLNNTTVFDDSQANSLTGGAALDWFFQGVADVLTRGSSRL